MSRNDPSPLPHLFAIAICIGAIPSLGAWPIPQAIANTILVTGFAPNYKSPLFAALVSATAGWLLELTLRGFPALGGVPLANITTTLIAHWSLTQWPPNQESTFRTRLAVLVAIHALLTFFAVQLAAGSHAWNLWGWIFSLGSSPLWAILVAKLYCPPQRR